MQGHYMKLLVKTLEDTMFDIIKNVGKVASLQHDKS